MSISTVDSVMATLNSNTMKDVASTPSAQEIEAFANQLTSETVPSPEAVGIAKLQDIQHLLTAGIDKNPAVDGLDPNHFLVAQANLAGSVIGVDIVTKVAGSFSQSVNKLVSMQ